MSTIFSFPLKSMGLALMFLVLFQTPKPVSATPGDFFGFQRFSAAELRHSLGFSSRNWKVAVQESSSTAESGERESPIARSQEKTAAAAAVASSSLSSPSSAVYTNSKALRGVRKLLFGTLSCAPQDLSLTQGPVSSTSGIPTFNVQIVNLCGACAMADIHVACGNWASATPVDPFVFTRLGYNDCLVNNGQPLSSQGSVSFQYSNSAMYPMSIATATNQCTR